MDDPAGLPTNLTHFEVLSGDWSVSKGGGRRSISFGFTINESFSDATDRDLSAGLTLYSACMDEESCGHEDDKLIPTEAGEIVKTFVYQSRVHLRGKAGVTHQADCHADNDSFMASGGTLVITATK